MEGQFILSFPLSPSLLAILRIILQLIMVERWNWKWEHLLIYNCSFVSNTATQGGAIHGNFVEDLFSSNSIFYNNQVKRHGGAIYLIYSTAAIFINVTVDRSASSIGAIYFEDSESEIHRSKISNSNRGGGVTVVGSILLITDSTIINNHESSLSGGGIYGKIQANITMRQVTCSFNSAVVYGGCMHLAGDLSLVVIQNCYIGRNSAQHGEGISIGKNATGILIVIQT